jgi:hypothetical protein
VQHARELLDRIGLLNELKAKAAVAKARGDPSDQLFARQTKTDFVRAVQNSAR